MPADRGSGAAPAPARDRTRRLARLIGVVAFVVGSALSTAVSAGLITVAVSSLSGNRKAPWILGRAAGITSYVLVVTLVAVGLILSHPWRTRISWPSAAARIRLHIGLAAFTLAFVVLHVVALATDSYAGVGWRGALWPMGGTYRPVAVTFGVIAVYAGLLAGVTAALAGRLTTRIWWPVHKVAVVTLILVWLHGVLSGSDSRVLLPMYLASGAGVALLAVSRYAARTPADRAAETSPSKGALP